MTVEHGSWISPEDRGFLLGDALFETVRLYRGHPFRLAEHLGRLEGAAGRFGIPIPSQLGERLGSALAEWGETDGALRITISRGIDPGLVPSEAPDPTLSIGLRSWRPDPAWYEVGVRAVVAGRVDERALTAGVKATAYLERIQALRIAGARGCDEALIRNTRGLVVEGAASNLMVWVDGGVVSPGPEDGALPGITRKVVLELLAENDVSVEERGVRIEELMSATEIILTSSLREIVPVVEVDGEEVGTGAPGPRFADLRERYRRVVEAAIP